MAETLSAILLVTTSARESSLVFRWPPNPKSSPRLARPKPNDVALPIDLDNPWKASNFPFPGIQDVHLESEAEYVWQRPAPDWDRHAFSHSVSHSTSGRNSPIKDGKYKENRALMNEYDRLFGYSSEFLASILCPQPSMCHQKFELIVDDLAFIGHPVCADIDGNWRFKQERYKSGHRGRESRTTRSSQHPSPDRGPTPDPFPPSHCSWLHTFHLVFVLDLPDPSSSASGNVSKYFDIVYEQIAFIVTAVLYQEQVLSNFVERECDLLWSLKDSCFSKSEPLSTFMNQALESSSVAVAMKALYEAIKSSSMSYLTINGLPLELRLPPHLDVLLHSTDDDEIESLQIPDEEGYQNWGPDMDFGWKLPSLQPWKSLLLLDDSTNLDSYTNLKSADDRFIIEGLVRFLDIASVSLSLADMASLLDWDLETQIYPTVRWLVKYQRARVVDVVHSGLKTVFTPSLKFEKPLSVLTEEFNQEFPHPSIMPLPQILSTISTAISKQTDNHFFASVVQSKELITAYRDVVLWMLKQDLLITLHLRIRIVATKDLKIRIRYARERALAKHRKGRMTGLQQELEAYNMHSPYGQAGNPWLSLSPKSAHKHFQRRPSAESIRSRLSEFNLRKDSRAGREDDEDKEMNGSDSHDEENSGWDTAEDHLWPSMINDPGRATPLQRRWLTAMSEGKPPLVAKRFNLINQYFDGKKTDDEILYRADITRKQLREVLHHYEEYLQTFLHPS